MLIDHPNRKDVENRPRWTSITGPVLLHASKRIDGRYLSIWADARREFGIEIPKMQDLETGGIIGKMDFGPCVSEHQSRWFTGPYAYPVPRIKRLKFMPWKGSQGFFNVPDGVLDRFYGQEWRGWD